ncbi:hypothetical protein FB45DRAFT_1117397 [Roridomyces roridus]|uniref:Uncharacterized protein n=1 Tax=Roridomyces roridus TaxID=1738132 RepID=A0AAD7FD10_9AGAR|nr:hypothetical protein FB45DRAFT_1117397 [Roridomyces roridus]
MARRVLWRRMPEEQCLEALGIIYTDDDSFQVLRGTANFRGKDELVSSEPMPKRERASALGLGVGVIMLCGSGRVEVRGAHTQHTQNRNGRRNGREERATKYTSSTLLGSYFELLGHLRKLRSRTFGTRSYLHLSVNGGSTIPDWEAPLGTIPPPSSMLWRAPPPIHALGRYADALCIPTLKPAKRSPLTLLNHPYLHRVQATSHTTSTSRPRNDICDSGSPVDCYSLESLQARPTATAATSVPRCTRPVAHPPPGMIPTIQCTGVKARYHHHFSEGASERPSTLSRCLRRSWPEAAVAIELHYVA